MQRPAICAWASIPRLFDFCDDGQFAPTLPDLEGEMRGLDFGQAPNGLGTFDLGADEYSGLFADGFESGDAVAWSDSVP